MSMLTPQRRHDHARVNARINARVRPTETGDDEDRRASSFSWWNVRGLGRFWKTQLHGAQRRYWREWLAGSRHPAYPGYLESIVNWRAD